MKRLLLSLFLVFMLATNGFAINDWKRGLGQNVYDGSTDSPSDIDTLLANYLQDPLDKVLTEYIHSCTLTRTSATVITVSAGEATIYNAAKTIKRMRRNTSTTTIDMTVVGVGGIDSGSAEKASTWYSVYAVADADATTFTAICTEQGVAPSDVTYYRYIGSFYNDASQNILNFSWSGNGQDITVMWDVPINITTALSAGVWSSATSCATAMPSTSIIGIFGANSSQNVATCQVIIRPNGSTNATNVSDGLVGYNDIAGELVSFTDSSQQIDYYNDSGDTGARIDVKGFILCR